MDFDLSGRKNFSGSDSAALSLTDYVSPSVLSIAVLALTAILIFLIILYIVRIRRLKRLNRFRPHVDQGLYREAVDGARQGLWEWDLTDDTIFFSGHWFGMLGYSEEEASRGLEFWGGIIHPEDRGGFTLEVEAYLSGKEPHYVNEYRIRRKNGEYIWFSDRGQAIFDEGGKPKRLVGLSMDITNQKRVEDVLQNRTLELEQAKNAIELEARNVRKFKLAVDSASNGVFIADPALKIMYVNASWERMNGYSFEEVQGGSVSIVESEKTPKEVSLDMERKLESGLSFRSDDIMRKRKNGTEYEAEIQVFPVMEKGQTLFFVGVESDVTERKQIERAKDEFVSLASHQLRTPLSAIRWHTEMLMSQYRGALNDDQKKYVNQIYESDRHMIDLVNALLNVSRIDLGIFTVEPKETDVIAVIESVFKELEHTIGEKKLSIERDLAEGGLSMIADEKLLRIIIQNLLSNAVKYTPDSGVVGIKAGKNEKGFSITVYDTGFGIPMEQQSKIFSKLFRADNVRNHMEGTGLGLYIVKAILDHSGGTISFESEEGKGTRFFVSFPPEGMHAKAGEKELTET